MKHRLLIFLVLVGVSLGVSSVAGAAVLQAEHFGAGVTLPSSPDYDWWYGCSPTSAGMMMGYYDINGYGGKDYSNLVAGGTAELSSFGNPGALANSAIASSGHIADFYSDGDGASGDDVDQPFHDFDCLADFMGTSQDSVGSSNGGTWFYNWTDGARFTAEDAVTEGVWNESGMYGIGEYVDYAGYDTVELYNQYVDTLEKTYGFSYDDYKAEIDAGRTVMIHVTGHSMFGYGYDDTDLNDLKVLLHDTWNAGEHSMTWGGAYSGRDMQSVTVMEISDGDIIPEPASLAIWSLFCILGLGYGRYRKRNAA